MTIDDRDYCCNEQFYLSRQALSSDHKDVYEMIMASSDPVEMKQHSKLYVPTSTWSENGDDVMKMGLVAKFTQNENLKLLLMNTKDQMLAEASDHDQYWGTGVSISHKSAFDQSKWTGLNMLGKLLMELRDELINGSETS